MITHSILESIKYRLTSLKDQFGTLTDLSVFEDESISYGQSPEQDEIRYQFDQKIFESFQVTMVFFDDNKKPIGDLVEIMEMLLKEGYPKNFKEWQRQITWLKKLKTLQIAERARFEKWNTERELKGQSQEMCSEAYRLQKTALEMEWQGLWGHFLKSNEGDKQKAKEDFLNQKSLTYFIFNKKIKTYVNESYSRALAEQAA